MPQAAPKRNTTFNGTEMAATKRVSRMAAQVSSELIDEKKAFLSDKLRRNVHLFFTHDPQCALAQVVQDEKGKFGTAHEVPELQARALAA